VASFIIRKIDDELWEKVKAQAEKEGRPLRWLLIRLLTVYAAKGLDVIETAGEDPQLRQQVAEYMKTINNR